MEDERHVEGMPVLDRQAVRVAAVPPGDAVHVAAVPPGDAVHVAATLPSLAVAPTRPTALPPSRAGLPLRSVPETKPTPLQKHYVLLSAPALVLGAVAITALELGVPIGNPLVKGCVLFGAPLLAVANADAIIRIWRSAWAWMPVDRAKGLFRLAWVAAGVILYALLVGATWLVLAP